MSIKFGNKKHKHNTVLFTVITALMICAVFLNMTVSFYEKAENEAYEMLHIQTKQIKDDLTLQLNSDRENLITMSNFAAKLYADGESYNLLFDSFKPIGLFSNIGILNPDGTFVTKAGTLDLNGKISFSEEAEKGIYISGRVDDLTTPANQHMQIVRSAVPINVDGKTVGILYGVIKLDTLKSKYNAMANELDAQLFVYDKATGKFVIDTINEKPGELSQLKTRKYNKGYSYEAFETSDQGYSSFKSIRSDEDLYIHYSSIPDFDWGILLARYETQVFDSTHKTVYTLLSYFSLTLSIIVIYIALVLNTERKRAKVTSQASSIRKLLLDTKNQQENIFEALNIIRGSVRSKASFFVDTDGEELSFIHPAIKEDLFCSADKTYFISELLRYASNVHSHGNSGVGILRLEATSRLKKANPKLYEFLKSHKVNRVIYSFIVDKDNLVSILGVVNPGNRAVTKALLEEISVCFSISIFNKKHLNKTELAATTDSLTGTLNRVAYNKDILLIDREQPKDFSCIYIDVNELHLRNNKYGHAAGDEMLIYIANSLKESFFGHYIYRLGGDEFLVFVKNISIEGVSKRLETFNENIKTKGYSVATGISYRNIGINCEEAVREAEQRMYESKAMYYQNKKLSESTTIRDEGYTLAKTGIAEIDTMLSVLKEHYNGIYKVSLDSDSAHRILMPSYLGYNETETGFSKLYSRYADDSVDPDYHRAFMSFLNYDAIKRQLSNGQTPFITYKKNNGETVTLSVYNLSSEEEIKDTLWVFSKE